MNASISEPSVRVAEHSRNRLLRSLLDTRRDVVPLAMRLGLGTVILAHGAQKVLGWFGGGGLGGTIQFFQEVLHLPAPVALFVSISDFVGSLALIFGLFTRVAALGAGAVMLGAILSVHASNGFFMNWAGNQAGEGFEFHILALALVFGLIVHGGGSASLDRALLKRLES